MTNLLNYSKIVHAFYEMPTVIVYFTELFKKCKPFLKNPKYLSNYLLMNEMYIKSFYNQDDLPNHHAFKDFYLQFNNLKLPIDFPSIENEIEFNNSTHRESSTHNYDNNKSSFALLSLEKNTNKSNLNYDDISELKEILSEHQHNYILDKEINFSNINKMNNSEKSTNQIHIKKISENTYNSFNPLMSQLLRNSPKIKMYKDVLLEFMIKFNLNYFELMNVMNIISKSNKNQERTLFATVFLNNILLNSKNDNLKLNLLKASFDNNFNDSINNDSINDHMMSLIKNDEDDIIKKYLSLNGLISNDYDYNKKKIFEIDIVNFIEPYKKYEDIYSQEFQIKKEFEKRSLNNLKEHNIHSYEDDIDKIEDVVKFSEDSIEKSENFTDSAKDKDELLNNNELEKNINQLYLVEKNLLRSQKYTKTESKLNNFQKLPKLLESNIENRIKIFTENIIQNINSETNKYLVTKENLKSFIVYTILNKFLKKINQPFVYNTKFKELICKYEKKIFLELDDSKFTRLNFRLNSNFIDSIFQKFYNIDVEKIDNFDFESLNQDEEIKNIRDQIGKYIYKLIIIIRK